MGECVSEQGSEGITEGVTVSGMHYLHAGNNLVPLALQLAVSIEIFTTRASVARLSMSVKQPFSETVKGKYCHIWWKGRYHYNTRAFVSIFNFKKVFDILGPGDHIGPKVSKRYFSYYCDNFYLS